MKRILLVSTLLTGRGGMETVTRSFCQLMSTKGIETKVLFLGKLKNKHNLDWLEGITWELVPQVPVMTSVTGLFTLIKIIKEWRPDIALGLNTGAIKALFLARKFSQRFPIVDWAHFSLEIIRKKRLLCKADYHLAISTGIKKELERDLGIRTEKIKIIYNPLPLKDNFLLPRPNEETLSLLYMGRLTKQKDLTTLLKGCSLLNAKWILHVVGDGEEMQNLKQLAENLNISSKIRWYGWKKEPWRFVRDEVKEISAFILTSKNEGFPMVLVEACAHGIFCISTNCKTGPSDIICCDNGILVPVGDEKSLCRAIEQLPQNIKRTSPESISRSIRKFNGEIYAREIIKALNEFKEEYHRYKK